MARRCRIQRREIAVGAGQQAVLGDACHVAVCAGGLACPVRLVQRVVQRLAVAGGAHAIVGQAHLLRMGQVARDALHSLAAVQAVLPLAPGLGVALLARGGIDLERDDRLVGMPTRIVAVAGGACGKRLTGVRVGKLRVWRIVPGGGLFGMARRARLGIDRVRREGCDGGAGRRLLRQRGLRPGQRQRKQRRQEESDGRQAHLPPGHANGESRTRHYGSPAVASGAGLVQGR